MKKGPFGPFLCDARHGAFLGGESPLRAVLNETKALTLPSKRSRRIFKFRNDSSGCSSVYISKRVLDRPEITQM